MDRRSFFRAMVGGLAMSAAVRTWPFRVYSFPTQITIPLRKITIPHLSLDEAFARSFQKYLDEYCIPFTSARSFSGGELQLGPVERVTLGV